MRIGFAALILVFSLAILHAQDAPDHIITISGSVNDSVTGRGIAGALVTLHSGPGKAEMAAMRAQVEQGGDGGVRKPFQPAAPKRAVTDANGKYSFAVPDTAFASIQASHSGYLSGFSQTQGDASQGINVKLVHTGVIEGRIVNSDGEPLPGVSVEMIQVQIQDGRRFLRTAQVALTNDLGDYRLWNIAPSSVYLKAVGYQGTYTAAGAAPAIANSSEAYSTVYFPASLDRESASVIRVGAGQTMRADFSMTPHKSYRIRGVIQDAASYKNLGVRLLNGEDAAGNRVSINTTSGAFQVFDVVPGTYTLQAFARGTTVSLGETSVAVDNQDLAGVRVPLSTGVDVQGVIEHVGSGQTGTVQNGIQDKDGDDDRDYTQRLGIPQNAPVQVVILQPGRIPVPGTQPPAPVNADGHFTFQDMLPGKYAFTITTFNEYVESIRSGSTDVLADGLEVGTASPEELRVTLRRGGGLIHGVVNGLHPGEGGTVVLIRAAGLSGIATVTQAFFDPNAGEAQFFAANLAPGEYQVYAWPGGKDVEFRNPEAMRALSASAVAVSLHEHGEEQVTLKVISTEIP
jgi:hypothetical protein